jgi:hypothetical protein
MIILSLAPASDPDSMMIVWFRVMLVPHIIVFRVTVPGPGLVSETEEMPTPTVLTQTVTQSRTRSLARAPYQWHGSRYSVTCRSKSSARLPLAVSESVLIQVQFNVAAAEAPADGGLGLRLRRPTATVTPGRCPRQYDNLTPPAGPGAIGPPPAVRVPLDRPGLRSDKSHDRAWPGPRRIIDS